MFFKHSVDTDVRTCLAFLRSSRRTRPASCATYRQRWRRHDVKSVTSPTVAAAAVVLNSKVRCCWVLLQAIHYASSCLIEQ